MEQKTVDAINSLAAAINNLARAISDNGGVQAINSEHGKNYPDFSAWKKNAITTESGLVFAPENLYVLDKQGRQKEYFTWDEAMDLERTVLRPAGWRLPTMEEWKLTTEEFKTSEALRSGLGIGFNGFIWWDEMDRYSKNPDSFSFSSGCALGYYWSCTPSSPAHARNLYFNSTGVNPQDYSKMINGFTVRCVAV